MRQGTSIILALLVGGGLLFWFLTRPAPTLLTNSSGPGIQLPPTSTTDGTSRFHSNPGAQANYLNDSPRFAFVIPDGFTADPYKAEIPNAQAILVKNAQGTELDATVVSPGGYQTPVNDASVRTQFPGRTISKEKSAQGPAGSNALSFEVGAADGAPATEVLWFIHDNYLYELTTSPDTPDFITYIVTHWSWGS